MSDDAYEQTRHRFEELDMGKQARFLIEASASTLARGVECVGHTLADELERVVQRANRTSTRSGSTGPGPAEPETSQRQSPRNGSSGAGHSDA